MFPLVQMLTRYWWVFGARGVLAILYGIFLLLSPGQPLHTFVIATGLFVLLESLLILFLIFGRHDEKILIALAESGVGTCIGLIILFGSTLGSLLMPSVTSVMVPIYIGLWAILTGLFGFIHAARLRSQVNDLWIIGLSSFVALLFGAWLVFHRNEGAISLQWPIAAYALLFGVLHVFMIIKAKVCPVKVSTL